MKKLLITISILASAVFFFASCDKIESDDYVVFPGFTCTWSNSTNDNIPDTQRAFLEKYTGVQCKNCPDADETIHKAMEKYGDLLNVASVHYSVFAEPIYNTDPDLRTDKGTLWGDYFITASGSLPSAMINRQQIGETWSTFNPKNSFDDLVDAFVTLPATIGMTMQAHNSFDAYSAELDIKFFNTIDAPLTVTLLVIEDDIHTAQIHGRIQIDDYQQNHVLREVITDAWGVDVDADGIAGTKRMAKFEFQLPAQCNPANCKLIAFISYKETKEIINSAQCNIDLL